jgi:hypothetical protein
VLLSSSESTLHAFAVRAEIHFIVRHKVLQTLATMYQDESVGQDSELFEADGFESQLMKVGMMCADYILEFV